MPQGLLGPSLRVRGRCGAEGPLCQCVCPEHQLYPQGCSRGDEAGEVRFVSLCSGPWWVGWAPGSLLPQRFQVACHSLCGVPPSCQDLPLKQTHTCLVCFRGEEKGHNEGQQPHSQGLKARLVRLSSRYAGPHTLMVLKQDPVYR